MGETFLNIDCNAANSSDYSSSENGSPQTCPGNGLVFPVPPQTVVDGDQDTILLVERRSFRPFKTSQDYLYAMREDLAEWLNGLYQLQITVDNFFEKLENGVILCQHANNVKKSADEHRFSIQTFRARFSPRYTVPPYHVQFRRDSAPGSFFARDNIHNFIKWCRDLGVHEVLMFETDDLVLRKNEKHVILALLEIARRGARFGMPAPLLVQMEDDIDREIEQDRLALEQTNVCMNGTQTGTDLGENWDEHRTNDEDHKPPNLIYGPQPQVVTNDLRSLDDMVRDLVERCTCPSQFPMIKVSEGKYRIGDTKVLIFVRILRNHVMVRVGGGWDTLHHYLDKHDPCRCRSGHRTTLSSKVGFKSPNPGERYLSSVSYERSEEGYPASPMTRRKSNGLRRDVLDGRSSMRHRSKSPAQKETNSHTLPRSGYKSDDKLNGKKYSNNENVPTIYTTSNNPFYSHPKPNNLVSPSLLSNTNGVVVTKPPSCSPNSAPNGRQLLSDNFLNKKTKSKSLCGTETYFQNDDEEFSKTKFLTPGVMDGRKISRSRSTTSVGGFQPSPRKENEYRQSFRSSSKNVNGKSTWNGRTKRDFLNSCSEPLKNTSNIRSVRSASASPAMTRKTYSSSTPSTPICRSPKRSVPNQNSNYHTNSVSNSPLPPKLLKKLSHFDGDGDTEVLVQLEGFVNNYRAYVLEKLAAEGRPLPPELTDSDWLKSEDSSKTRDMKCLSMKATPRKPCLGSRIPAPVF